MAFAAAAAVIGCLEVLFAEVSLSTVATLVSSGSFEAAAVELAGGVLVNQEAVFMLGTLEQVGAFEALPGIVGSAALKTGGVIAATSVVTNGLGSFFNDGDTETQK